MQFDHQAFIRELSFRTSRSSGSGGQHVNKVETRVEALWHVAHTTVLTPEQLERVAMRLAKRISAEGYVAVACSDTRSQGTNRERAIQRLIALVEKTLHRPPTRKKTTRPLGADKDRLAEKKVRATRKTTRQKPTTENE